MAKSSIAAFWASKNVLYEYKDTQLNILEFTVGAEHNQMENGKSKWKSLLP